MYVLCFNINISLTPTESIMKLMSVCVCVCTGPCIWFYCTSATLLLAFFGHSTAVYMDRVCFCSPS